MDSIIIIFLSLFFSLSVLLACPFASNITQFCLALARSALSHAANDHIINWSSFHWITFHFGEGFFCTHTKTNRVKIINFIKYQQNIVHILWRANAHAASNMTSKWLNRFRSSDFHDGLGNNHALSSPVCTWNFEHIKTFDAFANAPNRCVRFYVTTTIFFSSLKSNAVTSTVTKPTVAVRLNAIGKTCVLCNHIGRGAIGNIARTPPTKQKRFQWISLCSSYVRTISKHTNFFYIDISVPKTTS